MRRHIIISPLLLFLLAAGPAQAADPQKSQPRIKKCQDGQGKWHYGDTADAECARSKVIELDQRGIQRREISAPLTEQELKARQAKLQEEEEERKRLEEQQRRDQLLLATYAVEADIISMRDRKISEIGAQIAAAETTLKSLRASLTRIQAQADDERRGGKPLSPQTSKTLANNETQIARYEASIEKMRKDQDDMRTQYQTDLERFRDAKRRQLAAPAAKP